MNTKRVRFCDEINKSLHEIKELEASDDENSYENLGEFNGDDDESEEYEDDYELDPDELDEYDFEKFSDEDCEDNVRETEYVGLPKIQDLNIISADEQELQDNESRLMVTSIGENIQDSESNSTENSELSVSAETKHENKFIETQSNAGISLEEVEHLSENISENNNNPIHQNSHIPTDLSEKEDDSNFKESENSFSEKHLTNKISKSNSENFSASNFVQNVVEQSLEENKGFTEVNSQICENESHSKINSKQNNNFSKINTKTVPQSIESKTEIGVCDSSINLTPNTKEEINFDYIQDPESVAVVESSLKKISKNAFDKGYSENMASITPDFKDRAQKIQPVKYSRKLQNRSVLRDNRINMKHKKQTERLNSELSKAAINGASITELKESVYKTWLKIKSGNGKKEINKNEITIISNEPKELHKDLHSEAAFVTWKKSKNKARLKNKIKDIPPTSQKNISKCDVEENILAFKFWKQKKDEDLRKMKAEKYIKEQQHLESKHIVDTTRKIEAQAAFTAWKVHKSQIRKLSREKMKLDLEREKNIITIKEAKDKLAQEMYELWLENKHIC